MWLATSDVTSLYTVINHELGLRAIEYHLNKDQNMDPRQIEFLLSSINYILNHNYFWFKDTYYLQRQGTAMGTRFAPSHANLFMSWWEDNYIWNNEQVGPHLVLWQRYIDDVVFIWKGSESSLIQFTEHLNQNPLNLHFTTNHSKTKVNFLDLEIQINNNNIETITFQKPVDVNNYILATSNHHPNWLASIPRSQFTRIRRNCTHHTQFEQQSSSLAQQFLAKKYDTSRVQQALASVSAIDRQTLLQPRQKHPDPTTNNNNQTNTVLFITQYNDQARQVEKILTKHWHILLKDDLLAQQIGPKPRIIFRRAPNLSTHLVKNHIKEDKPSTWLQQSPGFYNCGRCICCKTLDYHQTKPTTEFSSIQTGNVYKLKDFMTCTTKQVIYLLECPCHLQYVGRTTRMLKDRIGEHLRNIKKGFQLHSVSEHFRTHHKCDPTGLKFTAIQKISVHWRGGDLIKLINTNELRWIFTLQTEQPKGLNIDTDLQQLI